VQVGQGNIEHEIGVVKKAAVLFHRSPLACAVRPSQVAPTEVERANCSKSDAKTTECGIVVRPCCVAYTTTPGPSTRQRRPGKRYNRSWCARARMSSNCGSVTRLIFDRATRQPPRSFPTANLHKATRLGVLPTRCQPIIGTGERTDLKSPDSVPRLQIHNQYAPAARRVYDSG
jgi:hypothetical protein